MYIPDEDLLTLQTTFTIDAAWWAEARVIAEALYNDTRPTLCKIKPWSTFATYMAFNDDATAAFNKCLSEIAPELYLSVSAAISSVLFDVGTPAASKTAPTGKARPTDDELRDRWLQQHPLTAYGMGNWRVYTNGLWAAVEETSIAQQIMNVLEDAKPDGVRPTNNLLSSVMTLARVKAFHPADVWDADPDLLICVNGMFHIPTKTLRAHEPTAWQTSGVPYAYDPQAGCPAFLAALGRLSYRVVQFLQEFAGYCLTTDTHYEVTVWFLGMPGSGKSSLIEGFNALLGDRAGVVSLKQIAASRFGLGNIEGKTLLYAFENPGTYIETTDMLNAIISGEKVIIERKYRDAIEIRSRAKILWAMNKLPRIADAENGIFRRVHIVRFDPLPESERDPRIRETIKTEGPGILNWALLGLERLRKRGRFDIPDEVQRATDEFQHGNDPEGAFVADRCEVNLLDPQVREQSSTLYAAYKEWCFDNGHRPKSSTSVANDWRRLGFERKRISGLTYWIGIHLLP